MAISLIKDFKQKQKISLTPLLKKSIDLLQLSRFELIQKIENEIEANPFIEKEMFDGDSSGLNHVISDDFDFNIAATESLRESLIKSRSLDGVANNILLQRFLILSLIFFLLI